MRKGNIVTTLQENDEGGYDCTLQDAATGQTCVVCYEHDANEADVQGELFCSAAHVCKMLMDSILRTNSAAQDGEYEDDGTALDDYYSMQVQQLQELFG
jgi:hypothetical protein